MSSCKLYRIFYTGRPGTGKSTIINKIINILKKKGCSIGGIIAPEVRSETHGRIGFQIVDVSTGRKGWLSRKGFPGPRVGKYGVVVNDVVDIGVRALKNALEQADVIVIDEIGPMELMVKELREAIVEVLRSNKPIVGVVHRRLNVADPIIYRLVASTSDIIEVTFENRNRLLEEVEKVAEKLCCKRGNQGRTSTALHS